MASGQTFSLPIPRLNDDPVAVMERLASPQGPFGRHSAKVMPSDSSASRIFRDARNGSCVSVEITPDAIMLRADSQVNSNTLMRMMADTQRHVDGGVAVLGEEISPKFKVAYHTKYYDGCGSPAKSLLHRYTFSANGNDLKKEHWPVELLAVLACGEKAISDILSMMQFDRYYLPIWDALLREITGATIGSRCTTKQGRQTAWLSWGRRNGHRPT